MVRALRLPLRSNLAVCTDLLAVPVFRMTRVRRQLAAILPNVIDACEQWPYCAGALSCPACVIAAHAHLLVSVTAT